MGHPVLTVKGIKCSVPQAVLLLVQTSKAGDISEAESCPGRGVEILKPEEVPVLVVHSIGEHHRPPPLHKVAVEVPCPWEPLLVGHLQPLSRLVGKYYFEKIFLGDTKIFVHLMLGQLLLVAHPVPTLRWPLDCWVRGVVEDLHLGDVQAVGGQYV